MQATSNILKVQVTDTVSSGHIGTKLISRKRDTSIYLDFFKRQKKCIYKIDA